MAVVAGLSVWELAALAAAAVAAMFTATPQGQQAVKNTAQAISDLARPADESDAPATPDAVQDCPPAKDDTNDNCKPIYEQIYKTVAELQDRKKALLVDDNDLYHQAYDKPNPALGSRTGSYLGHIHQAQGIKNRLRNLIAEAEGLWRCPVPLEIKKLLDEAIPDKPESEQ
jgi:hypothetical protein